MIMETNVAINSPRRAFTMVTFGRAIWLCNSFRSHIHYYHSWVHFHIMSTVTDIYQKKKSSPSAVFYPHRPVWIYFWPVDGCYHILFCSSNRRTRCIYRLSLSLPNIYRILASLLHLSQACRSCRRKATQATLSNSTSTLPLQCYELSIGSLAYSDTPYIHGLHRPLLIQSDHSHQSWRFHTFFPGLSCQTWHIYRKRNNVRCNGTHMDNCRHYIMYLDPHLSIHRCSSSCRRWAGWWPCYCAR